MIKPFFLILVSSLLLSACSNKYTRYEDPEELDQLLQEFKVEAEKRHYPLIIPEHFLVKLVGEIEGRDSIRADCSKDIPMLIRLEKDYWLQADMTQKRILFFHELGHCLLNRNHSNQTLPNGEWQSLMRGGVLPQNRSYNINLRGFRKDYYLDELFGLKPEVPHWATRREKLNIKSEDWADSITINDPEMTPDKWKESDIKGAGFRFDSFKYSISNNHENKLAVSSVKIKHSTSNNFIIDSNVQISLSNHEEGIGLIFGEPHSLEYMAIIPELGVKVGNLGEFRPYTTIPIELKPTDDKVRMTIQNKEDELLYFLNGALVYHTANIDLTSDELYMGYYVAPGSSLTIYGIDIYYQ